MGTGTCCGAHGRQTNERGGGGGGGGGGEERKEAKTQGVEGLEAKVEAKMKSLPANEIQPFTPSLPNESVDKELVYERGRECGSEAVRDAGGVIWYENARVEMDGGQGAEMEKQDELVAMGFTREQVGTYKHRYTHRFTACTHAPDPPVLTHTHTYTHTHIHESARVYIHFISLCPVWHNLSLSPPLDASRRQQR